MGWNMTCGKINLKCLRKEGQQEREVKRIVIPLDPHIKRIIDLIGLKLNERSSLEGTIIISGAPRTGTTLLMEILATLPGYKTIYEPLHPNWFPSLFKLGFPPRIYLNTEEDNELLYNHLKNVFSGKGVAQNPHYFLFNFKEVYRRISFNKICAKFVNGNRLLPWISDRFTLKATFLIIRHPCATISSQLKTGFVGYPREYEMEIRKGNVKFLKRIILEEISMIDNLKEKQELINKINGMKTLEELLAVEWSLDYVIPLYFFNKYNWHLIIYERLIKNSKDELINIFDKIGENVPKKAYKLIKKPSRTSLEKKIYTQRQLHKWKNHLSKKQIEGIFDVVNFFGIDFYNEDVEPDDDALAYYLKSKNKLFLLE